MAYTYCQGCNTHYVDTGCGQTAEHARCPVQCSLCGLLLDGRDTDRSCPGHTIAQSRAAVAQRRGRDHRCPDDQPHEAHEWFDEPPIFRLDCPGC